MWVSDATRQRATVVRTWSETDNVGVNEVHVVPPWQDIHGGYVCVEEVLVAHPQSCLHVHEGRVDVRNMDVHTLEMKKRPKDRNTEFCPSENFWNLYKSLNLSLFQELILEVFGRLEQFRTISYFKKHTITFFHEIKKAELRL